MGFSLLCFPHNFSPFLPSFSFLRISSSSFSLLLLSTYDRGPRGCRAGGVSWSQLSHRWGPPAGTVPPRQAPAQLRPVVRQSSAPEMPHKFPPFPSPPPLPPQPLLTHKSLLLAVPQRCRPDAIGHQGKEGLLDLSAGENSRG